VLKSGKGEEEETKYLGLLDSKAAVLFWNKTARESNILKVALGELRGFVASQRREDTTDE